MSAWEEVLPGRLHSRETKSSVQEESEGGVILFIYLVFHQSWNTMKRIWWKQWCTDSLCPVTQALHISSQCPGLSCSVKSNWLKCNKLYSVKKHPITSFMCSLMHHQSCNISFTERCVHDWNILQIPQRSDKQDFMNLSGRGSFAHSHAGKHKLQVGLTAAHL